LGAAGGAGALILLDTHVLVWFALAPERLGAEARLTVAAAVAEQRAWLAVISTWELSMLAAKGRYQFGMPVLEFLQGALIGIGLAPITAAIGVDAGQFADLHGDPADRLIIATARHLRCPLVTADRAILSYAAEGHLRVVDARH
jgi:PIN domain nuclease of toxin-antitoxin system